MISSRVLETPVSGYYCECRMCEIERQAKSRRVIVEDAISRDEYFDRPSALKPASVA